MPRVLRIINRLNLGGPTYNVAYLSKYLSSDFETLLVSGMKDDSEESSEFIVHKLGLEPVYIPEMKREIDFKNDRIAYKKIKQTIKDFKPDIVHTHAAKSGAIGRLAANACDVPVIIHTFHGHVFHSYFSPLKTKIFIGIEKYLASKSDKIIAISDKQKYELAEIYKICDADKIAVIPLGFDLSKFQENIEDKRKQFRSLYNVNDDEIVISIIGRLVPIKNHYLFLEAIKYVAQNTTKKIRAFIIGDGELRSEIEQKASALGIDFIDGLKSKEKALLTFTSWIKDIDYVTAGSDIIALTSLNEGTPVSLIEAQAANRAIVATNVGGIENISSPNSILLSDSGDLQAFQANLLRIVNDDKLLLSMQQDGWNFVREKFHYTRLVGDMERLYKQLLNNT